MPKLKLAKPVFLKQKNMVRVLWALLPVIIGAVYFFGWRTLAVIGTSVIACFLTEYLMENAKKGKVSYACFVTAVIYGLSLPPTIPLWIAAVGGIIAILFAKEAFGGFGKNIFNPAAVGRAFVYVCFPPELTSAFVPVIKGTWRGFTQWSALSGNLSGSLSSAGHSLSNAVSSATPLLAQRDLGHTTSILNLFLGTRSEQFSFEGTSHFLAAGSLGEICMPILFLGAAILLLTKTAQPRLIFSTLIGAIFSAVLFAIPGGASLLLPSVAATLFSGGLMYAAVFMVTDPVSAPKLPLSQWMYGFFIGAIIVFFRHKSIFVEGVGFSILLGNMLAPSFDLWLKRILPAKTKVLK
jgi:Na+-transporting NADH:ubiquinone oxidoreductase subunit B